MTLDWMRCPNSELLFFCDKKLHVPHGHFDLGEDTEVSRQTTGNDKRETKHLHCERKQWSASASRLAVVRNGTRTCSARKGRHAESVSAGNGTCHCPDARAGLGGEHGTCHQRPSGGHWNPRFSPCCDKKLIAPVPSATRMCLNPLHINARALRGLYTWFISRRWQVWSPAQRAGPLLILLVLRRHMEEEANRVECATVRCNHCRADQE